MSKPYCHRLGDKNTALPVGKVVCVGRNYRDHVKELNNPLPAKPLLFIKPSTAVVDVTEEVRIPSHLGECHNELEVSLLLDKKLSQATATDALDAICGVGLGLDLTLRDVQSSLKQQGHPWERAKAFDGSCPLSPFIDIAKVNDLQSLAFHLSVNGNVRQTGNTAHMIFAIADLLVEMSHCFTLLPGDVILTGTPAGVAALSPGDNLELALGQYLHLTTQVTARDN